MADNPVEQLKATLRGYCTKIPPTHSAWSYDRARAFKKAIQSAQTTLTRRGVSAGSLTAKINEMRAFW